MVRSKYVPPTDGKVEKPNRYLEDFNLQAKSLLNNSIANLLRAASASAVSIIIPLILVWRLPSERYAMWALLFGIGAWVLFLDFGLAATLQVAVAKTSASGDYQSQRPLVHRILLILAVLTGSIQLLAAALGASAAQLFPELPDQAEAVFGASLFVICLGQGSTLVANILTGFYMATHRTMEPTRILLLSRILSVGSVSVASFFSTDIVLLSIFFSMPLLAGCITIIFLTLREVRTRSSRIQISSGAAESDWTFGRILAYSAPLALWNVALLVITGSGVWIVGQSDYAALGAYSIAIMIITVMLGLENAVLGPLLSELSHRFADGSSLKSYLLRSSRINSVFIGVVAIILFAVFVSSASLLPKSIGQYLTIDIVACLLVGNMIRLALAPLGLAFVASGHHKMIILPPIVESALYFVALYTLGNWLGLLGLAIGTVVGSIIGTIIKLQWSLSIASIPNLRARTLALDSIIRPLVSVAPVGIAFVGVKLITVPNSIVLAMFLTACVLSVVLLVFVGLTGRDRKFLLKIFGQKTQVPHLSTQRP